MKQSMYGSIVGIIDYIPKPFPHFLCYSSSSIGVSPPSLGQVLVVMLAISKLLRVNPA